MSINHGAVGRTGNGIFVMDLDHESPVTRELVKERSNRSLKDASMIVRLTVSQHSQRYGTTTALVALKVTRTMQRGDTTFHLSTIFNRRPNFRVAARAWVFLCAFLLGLNINLNRTLSLAHPVVACRVVLSFFCSSSLSHSQITASSKSRDWEKTRYCDCAHVYMSNFGVLYGNVDVCGKEASRKLGGRGSDCRDESYCGWILLFGAH